MNRILRLLLLTLFTFLISAQTKKVKFASGTCTPFSGLLDTKISHKSIWLTEASTSNQDYNEQDFLVSYQHGLEVANIELFIN